MSLSIDHGAGSGRLWRSLIVWGAAAALIIAPILAMDMVEERADLAFLGALLLMVGVGYEIAARLPVRFAYAAGLALAVLTGLAHVVINGAVGIIGSEDNPANRIYLAVLAVAVLGSLVALLRARWMVWAMAAAAATQIAVFAYAWATGLGFTGPITVFFSAMWLIAGGLFRRAAAGRTALRA